MALEHQTTCQVNFQVRDMGGRPYKVSLSGIRAVSSYSKDMYLAVLFTAGIAISQGVDQ